MHEFSIAVGIVDLAEETARNNKATIIESIEIEVGELSGIEFDALVFAMESAKKETMLHDAKVNITSVKGKAKCIDCNTEFATSDLYTLCPNCQSLHNDVIQGKEMKVKSIQVN